MHSLLWFRHAPAGWQNALPTEYIFRAGDRQRLWQERVPYLHVLGEMGKIRR